MAGNSDAIFDLLVDGGVEFLEDVVRLVRQPAQCEDCHHHQGHLGDLQKELDLRLEIVSVQYSAAQ